MDDEALIRNEDCRLDVLNALHARRTGAHQADTIRTVFLRQRDYTLKEVETALSDLERRHHAEQVFENEFSSLPLWQITGQGITFKERGMK
jgi:hypothetical protein